ncbi:transcription factor MYB28 [Prunus yedoensis var. nudiflora]|uniref:Transcription factor MYB28 n=1 Tax=Prunus yedoensis var. nudiflora TaxID=2094558 RepID=A0A315AX14_PRUYE|nr:transcription factor MYB28 [Prunus yedoensis var. nudiflora]
MTDMASSHLTGTNSKPDIASFQFPRTLNPSLPPLPSSRTQFEYSESFLSSTGSVYSVKSELPSSQVSQTQSEVTIDTKVSSAAAAAAVSASQSHISNGLLEDLLQEAEVLACGGGNPSKRANGLFSSFEEKHVLDNYARWLQSTSSMEGSLLEAKPIEDDHISSVPEDLSKLFSFIPSTTDPISDWYSDSGELSNGHSSGVTDACLDFDMQQHMASLFPVAATAEHGRTSSSWDNMPGIC